MELQQILTRINEIMHRAILESKREAIGNSSRADLTLAQLSYIEAVHILKRPSLTALAAELKVTKASASSSVHKLLRSGLLQAERSDEDGRVYFISLTEEGRSLIDAQASSFHRLMEGVRESLSKKEIEELGRMLEKVAKARGM